MKIGVAIPCYYGHIQRLYDLLESIEKQTILPDKVVVSSSSTSELTCDKIYSFPLEVIVTECKQNASKNRNVAASKLLDMNYITFIDADDIMHPQRIEFLLIGFQRYDSDIILHNYFESSKGNVKDLTSGYILCSRDLALDLLPEDGYGEYCIEFLSSATNRGMKTTEVGYICLPRRHGYSKTGLTMAQLINTGFPYLLVAIKNSKFLNFLRQRNRSGRYE